MSKGGSAPGWNEAIHKHWIDGDEAKAIDAIVSVLNRYGRQKPLVPLLQFVFYLYHARDFATAARILEDARQYYPDDPQLLLNLAVCLVQLQAYGPAEVHYKRVIALRPHSFAAWDGMCALHHALGNWEAAAEAGSRSLELKDSLSPPVPPGWRLPEGGPRAWLGDGDKSSVVSFSLWGASTRYLRGALDNALQAPALYPGWKLRFYCDASVPMALRVALNELGAEVVLQPLGQSLQEKLTWRFKVADDTTVGRFLVRDVDSVVNDRERRAVEAWVVSDRWFHVMRDWWSHSDLILAGMWGGVAGILPSIGKMLSSYKAPAVGGKNIDQWFLRDKVWRFVRQSSLVHDRFFVAGETVPWPGPSPTGDEHVGMNVAAAQTVAQLDRLRAALPSRVSNAQALCSCLGL